MALPAVILTESRPRNEAKADHNEFNFVVGSHLMVLIILEVWVTSVGDSLPYYIDFLSFI